MGSKSSPKPIEPPNIQEMLGEQARYNRVDTQTPYGSQQWTQTPDGRYQANVQFSEPMQALFDRQLMQAAQGPRTYSYQGSPMMGGLASGLMDRMGYGSESAMAAGGGGKPRTQASPQPQLPQIDMSALLAKQQAQQQASQNQPAQGGSPSWRDLNTPGVGGTTNGSPRRF